MSARSNAIIGNMIFWLFMLAASGGAFSAGFYYTYGATANVGTKVPVQPLLEKGMIRDAHAKPASAAVGLASAVPIAVATSVATPPPPTVPPTTEPSVLPLIEETPKPRPSPSEAGPEIYRVQVGAFETREIAQRQVDELQGMGINAVVVYDSGAYHAQLGAFSDRARAISVADEVNVRGYSVTIRH